MSCAPPRSVSMAPVMRRTTIALVGAILVTSLAGCKGSNKPKGRLKGAGSSFVAPLMEDWSRENESGGVEVDYATIGSRKGVASLFPGEVDFACTDYPLDEEQLKKFGGKETVVHVPLVIGAVVPIYNLEGIKGPLRFTGPVLADIYLGKIKKWNDKALQQLNPLMRLPDREIKVVYRADPSSATAMWVNYLARVSPEWKRRVGAGTSVTWPTGEAGVG